MYDVYDDRSEHYVVKYRKWLSTGKTSCFVVILTVPLSVCILFAIAL